MTDDVNRLPRGDKILILAPIEFQGKKGEHKSIFEQLRKEGFAHTRVDGGKCAPWISDINLREKSKNIPSTS